MGRRLGFGLRRRGSWGRRVDGGLLGFRGERRLSVCGGWSNSGLVRTEKGEKEGMLDMLILPEDVFWFAVFGIH